jgi:hypothetical protein
MQYHMVAYFCKVLSLSYNSIVTCYCRWHIVVEAMKKILVENVEDNMVLAREVCGASGNVLLSKGITLSEAIGRRLQNWGITSVYIEGEEEMAQEESSITISPEELKGHLLEKFSKTLHNQYMKKIFDAVYQYRLNNSGK